MVQFLHTRLQFEPIATIKLYVAPRCIPFRSSLEGGEVFCFPSCPIKICQILDAVPPPSQIHIFSLEYSWWRDGDGQFESQDVVR